MDTVDAINPAIVGAVVTGAADPNLLLGRDVAAATFHGIVWDIHKMVVEDRMPARPLARRWLAQLRGASLDESMKNATTATTVAAALDAGGVAALVYKGTALVAQTLGDWRGRDSQDVDILVAPEQVTAAHHILMDLNYVRRDGQLGPPSRSMRYYECERTYEGHMAPVDLHWRVDAAPGFLGLSFQELWDARERVAVEGLQVWTPGQVDALLISAVHGTRERWVRLRWALDVARQFRRLEGPQWSILAERSQRGAAKSLHLALAIVQQCGVEGLPWQASQRAAATAQAFLAHGIAVGYGRVEYVKAGTTSAWERRQGRVEVAPRLTVALDDLSRAALRQFLGSSDLSLVPFRGRAHSSPQQ